MDVVGDRQSMRLLLQHWIAEDQRAVPPTGRWAIELNAQHRVIGGVVMLYLPPGGQDLEIGWQLVSNYSMVANVGVAPWSRTMVPANSASWMFNDPRRAEADSTRTSTRREGCPPGASEARAWSSFMCVSFGWA